MALAQNSALILKVVMMLWNPALVFILKSFSIWPHYGNCTRAIIDCLTGNPS